MDLTAASREAEPAAEQTRSVPDVESALDGDLQAFDRLVLDDLPRTLSDRAGDAVQVVWPTRSVVGRLFPPPPGVRRETRSGDVGDIERG